MFVTVETDSCKFGLRALWNIYLLSYGLKLDVEGQTWLLQFACILSFVHWKEHPLLSYVE